MKEITKSKIFAFCLSDFAKGIFTGMLANYLIFFFQPDSSTGITPVITQGVVIFGVFTLIGLVKAVGHIFDAFTDPLVAHWSDKCRSKQGRRIPFMKWSAIPFGLSTLLIFLPPMPGIHWLNNVWVSIFIWLHFFFYTVYIIPQGALFPELIKEPNTRIFAYSIRSLLFVAGSAVIYMVPLPVSLLQKAGLSANLAYQVTFIVLSIIGIALLLASSFAIKERDYVEGKVASVKLFPALKATFKNKEFSKFTVANLFQTTSMSFFQACIMYYVVTLLELSMTMASLILGISIAVSVMMYPFIVRLCKKVGKRPLLLSAIAIFILGYLAIYFLSDWQISSLKPSTFNLIKGIGFAIVVSFPFATLNIVPSAILSDIIQYDTYISGENKEGLFSASQSFVTKLGTSLAIMIVPSVIAIGASSGSSVGRFGVKLTAIISAIFCALSLIFFWFYREKKILSFIKARRAEEKSTLLAETLIVDDRVAFSPIEDNRYSRSYINSLNINDTTTHNDIDSIRNNDNSSASIFNSQHVYSVKPKTDIDLLQNNDDNTNNTSEKEN